LPAKRRRAAARLNAVIRTRSVAGATYRWSGS